MLGTTHQLIALLAAFWLLTLFPVSVGPVAATLAIIAVMVGALTPDLDQPTANIWRRLLGGSAIGNIFQFFSGGHRHFTHSLLGIAAIGYGTYWLATHLINVAYVSAALIVWRAFMIGYISHPVADTFTDRGVPWLWPIRWHLRLPPGPEELRVTTDSWIERWLLRGALLAAFGLLLTNYWSVLPAFFHAA